MARKQQQRDPYETDRTVPFTNKEMELMCGVTPMTLWIWRKGAPSKTGKLKTVKGRGPREVRYPVPQTMAWLRANEVSVQVHPDDLGHPSPSQFSAAVSPAAPRKPGPKPKASAAAASPRRERPAA